MACSKDKLKDVERFNRLLYRAYPFKEEFRQVMYSRLPVIKHFARWLCKDMHLVLNYFTHNLANALSEAMNSVIRSIQRRANGYRDMTHLALKVHQKAGTLR